MYAWMWRQLPGPWPVRALAALVLFAVVVVVCLPGCSRGWSHGCPSLTSRSMRRVQLHAAVVVTSDVSSQ